MYGTIGRCQVMPGHFGEVEEILREWGTSIKPLHAGAIATYTYRADADPDAVFIVAVFSDKASYQAQGAVPEQGIWFGRLREHLVDDPQWNDGEIVASA
jgi:quinol monooxygenase YgiN